MMSMNTLFCLLLITVGVVVHQSSAFTTSASVSCPLRCPDTSLHGFFDAAMKNAFGNEELGAKQNAGISGAGPMASAVTINGKKIQGIANQKVSIVAQAARVKINYSCNAGSCGTCRIKMNGKEVRACQAKVTPKKCDIRTL
mmetsp:Transcript_7075/g.7991  ORF Transcript_7075/g.7991 Transcript_7075/m.7991 type:complete len:142 (-) Transcript_7075:298-723(-)